MGGRFCGQSSVCGAFCFRRNVGSICTVITSDCGSFSFRTNIQKRRARHILQDSVPNGSHACGGFRFFPSLRLNCAFPGRRGLLISCSHHVAHPRLFFVRPCVACQSFCSTRVNGPSVHSRCVGSFRLGCGGGVNRRAISTAIFRQGHGSGVRHLHIPCRTNIALSSVTGIKRSCSANVRLDKRMRLAH